jgi:hypothetical protein
MQGDGADRFEAFVDALAEVVGHADRIRPLRLTTLCRPAPQS